MSLNVRIAANMREKILIMNNLDDFLDNLQNEIFEDGKKELGEKGFQDIYFSFNETIFYPNWKNK